MKLKTLLIAMVVMMKKLLFRFFLLAAVAVGLEQNVLVAGDWIDYIKTKFDISDSNQLPNKSQWVVCRPDLFKVLNFHTPGVLAEKVKALELGESAIFYKALKRFNFGYNQIQGYERYTRPENGSEWRSWRMWEYLTALFLSSALNWETGLERDVQGSWLWAVRGLSPHVRWLSNGENGDYASEALVQAQAIGQNYSRNRAELVGPFVKAVFNKYCQVVTDAKTKVCGSWAKLAKISGQGAVADSDNLGQFDKEAIVDCEPLYLSVANGKVLVSTSKIQMASRVDNIQPARVRPLFQDLYKQNNIIEFSRTGQQKLFNALATDNNLLRFWQGLTLKTGSLIYGLSDPKKFFKENGCKEEAGWQGNGWRWSGRVYGSGDWQWTNRAGNGIDHGDNWGYKNASENWLKFGGDLTGYKNPLLPDNLQLQGLFICDSPLLGEIIPDAVAKYTGKVDECCVYGHDGQIYKVANIGSGQERGLLRYRDACYDCSAGPNVVAAICGSDKDTSNNDPVSPKCLFVKSLPGAQARGILNLTEFCSSFPDVDKTKDTDVDKALEAEAAVETSPYKSPFTSGARIIDLPAGEEFFKMVEVGLDDKVWVLGSSGVPYCLKEGNTLESMIGQLQNNVRFVKIAVGAHKAFSALGITDTGEIYVLVDPELKIWQNTELKGTHASIDNNYNLAIIGFDRNIYKLKNNDVATVVGSQVQATPVAPVQQLPQQQAQLPFNRFDPLNLFRR